MQKLIPQSQAPQLKVKLTNGETWSLQDQKPTNFSMIVFYRGLHCPVCEKYLKTLDSLLDQYAQKGVEVIAVSMDGEARARRTRTKWELSDNLKIGYELNAKDASAWGLYLSKAIKDYEPNVFNAIPAHLNDCDIVFGRVNYWRDGKIDYINEPILNVKRMLQWWLPNSYVFNPTGYFYKRQVQEKYLFPKNISF